MTFMVCIDIEWQFLYFFTTEHIVKSEIKYNVVIFFLKQPKFIGLLNQNTMQKTTY